MVVESVRVHMLSSQHVVILKESDRERYLPIWIGPSEANAIAMRLQGLSAERPLTHDLLVSVVAALNSSISRVVVTHVTDGTFHARLYLETSDGGEAEIDSRTSDAIATAVRTGSTIYVDERVLDEAGVEPDLWKVEGLDRRADCQAVVRAARGEGRERVGCIVLGRGADEQKVRDWLGVAAGVPGFVGFAVGRTDFWQPLVAWRAGTATREQAVAEIARRYHEFVDLFEGRRLAVVREG